MIEQQLETRKWNNSNKYKSGMIDRHIDGLDDIPKGYKIKCGICKKYKFVLDLRKVNNYNYICKSCRRK